MGQYGRPNLALAGILVLISSLNLCAPLAVWCFLYFSGFILLFSDKCDFPKVLFMT